MNKKAEAQLDAQLADLWERGLPTVRRRLDLLDRAAAAKGNLTEALRAEAIDVAHKFSGSLGMFGYPRGTEIAREIEQLLNLPGQVEPDRFAALVAELRRTLFPGG